MTVKEAAHLPLRLNQQETSYYRTKVSHSFASPLAWLKNCDHYPKWYIQKPGSAPIATCGMLTSFDSLPEYSLTSQVECPPKILGGQDFFSHPRKTALWDGIPSQLYALPAYEVFGKHVYCYAESQFPSPPSYSPKKEERLSHYNVQTTPSFLDWCKGVNLCTQEMKDTLYEKIVLARVASYSFASSIPLYSLLDYFTSQALNATVFGVIFSEDLAFLGVTPETLFSTHGREIFTHAVAGTRPRGLSHEDDSKLALELQCCKKEYSEFNYVHTAIYEALSPLCESLSLSNETSIIKTSQVQHLHKQCKGILKPSISVSDVLSHLHPTPAVGGFPRKPTLQKIYAIESFDRGWYAAPFGYVTHNESHFSVAIRSALVRKNVLSAFSGTGLIDSSIAENEWEELNNKIAHVTKWMNK